MTTALTSEPSASRHVGGHLEVHDVAGVVLDDVQDARAAVDGLGRLHHLVGRGRGEHLARARRVEHALPHEPSVHRLVTRAAAGDDADLALHRRVGAHDVGRVVGDLHAVAVRRLDALERIPEHLLGIVDELLHAQRPF